MIFKGLARMARGSLKASPIRASPTSRARIREINASGVKTNYQDIKLN